jgi:hypothetical protein
MGCLTVSPQRNWLYMLPGRLFRYRVGPYHMGVGMHLGGYGVLEEEASDFVVSILVFESRDTR